MAKDLTERQRMVFKFINRCIQERGFPPTVHEIQDEFSFKSPTGVVNHLRAIEKKGYIRIHPQVARGIELLVKENLLESETHRSIPLVGRIAAGKPILAVENIEKNVVLDRDFCRGANFMLRVRGDSMVNAGILDGDYVLVKQQSTAENGEIVVALVDDEATVKRFFREKDRITLKPENDAFPPLVIEPEQEGFRIIGKVVGLYRTV